ncbi:FAD-dependent oxidoreductase [Paenibacillaceae bacterium]|nr:FAD-dependent oxidoreductase [Paenibacillaceae bacterium]
MNKRIQLRVALIIVAAGILIVAALAAIIYWKQSTRLINKAPHEQLIEVKSTEVIAERYDAIVTGTDPEGVAAALSAARNGLKVLLVEGSVHGNDRKQLGGLMTIGWLNTLDLNYSPKNPSFLTSLRKPIYLNKGIFQEWYEQIEGSSFDTNTAANVFYRMVAAEPNIDLLMNVQSMTPIMSTESGTPAVVGLNVVKSDGSTATIAAEALIDATQDADIAAAAGAPYTVGREDIGNKNVMMVATLVFKLSGVTQEIWEKIGSHSDAGIDKMSIWGYNAAREYVPSNPDKVKIRGLNIGRQNDGTILLNTMQLFDVDPLDPESVRQGIAIGEHEAPLIADFLIKRFDEFKDLKYAGTASELYIRESRHINGEYRVTLADLMENRDHWDAIAYGSYAVDIQSTSSGGIGTILMNPAQYGVPFRSLVPLEVDGLLVIGRAASFDSVPHGSARVIPLGMATGEAAGAAVKLAKDEQITFRDLSKSEQLVNKLKQNLTKQGMDLKMNSLSVPAYVKHKAYKGLVAAANMNLTSGSYSNDAWDLDGKMNVQRFLNMLRTIRGLHPDKFESNLSFLTASVDNPAQTPLTLNMALYMFARAMGIDTTLDEAKGEMLSQAFTTDATLALVEDQEQLSNGEVFLLIRDIAIEYLGASYE